MKRGWGEGSVFISLRISKYPGNMNAGEACFQFGSTTRVATLIKCSSEWQCLEPFPLILWALPSHFKALEFRWKWDPGTPYCKSVTDSVSSISKNKTHRDQRDASLANGAAAKPDVWSSVPGTHMVERRGPVIRVTVWPPYAHHDTGTLDMVALFLLTHIRMKWIYPAPQTTLKWWLLKPSTKTAPIWFSLDIIGFSEKSKHVQPRDLEVESHTTSTTT